MPEASESPRGFDLVPPQPFPFVRRVIPARGPALRLFVDFNPFYVLSAICMLFGVFALNDSFTWSPLPSRNLLTVLVMINVYEAMLIGLAMVLLRRGIRRDATVLLLIETFFLADVGFLNIELFGLSLGLGLTVNALVMLAAAGKAIVLMRAARLRLHDGRLAFVLMQLLVLFALPGVIAVIGKHHDTFVSPLVLYAAWWVTALLPIAYAFLASTSRTAGARPTSPAAAAAALSDEHSALLWRVLLVLPMLSIVAHLSLCHWVYKVVFHPADLAPLLVGAAVAVGRAEGLTISRAARGRLQFWLPAVAIFLSAFDVPGGMTFLLGNMPVTPLRVVFGASMLAYVDALWLHRQPLFAFAAAGCGGGMFMGHSVSSINDNSLAMAERSKDSLTSLLPHTLHEWGVVAVGAAFVLLALGAVVSLTRKTWMRGQEGTGS